MAENKLFWTPEVIAFFGITDETLKREYEFAREEIQRSILSKKDGDINGRLSQRRGSYVNIGREFLNDNEITEEFASGDSGSTKNSKKIAPQFFETSPSAGRS